MSEITVIGLGLMGAALTRALLGAGRAVTVWNRSGGKMAPLVALGAVGAADFGAAVGASPVVLICIDNYAATAALLQGEGIAGLLPGRVVVQLSTGTPKEAATMGERVAAAGGLYLDGAILCGPDDIGTPEGEVLLSGSAAAHARAGGLLACLGGRTRYLGDTVGAASALDLAWLNIWYGQFTAIIHSAQICRAEGVDLAEFMALFPADPGLQGHVRTIRDQSYAQRTATLAVWGEALERIREQAADAGISAAIPDFHASFFRKAVDAGFGDENVMALFKTLAPR